MNDHLLRPAGREDLAGILELLGEVDLPPEGVEDHLENFWVVIQNGQVVGTVGVERYGESGLLRSLAVHPDYRGQGWGSRLAEEALRVMEAWGCKEVYLLTEQAEGFFSEIGFSTIPREVVPESVLESWEFRASRCQAASCMKMEL